MIALPPVAGADVPGVAGRRRDWAIVSVLAAMALVVLDAAIANVALPTIGRSLEVAPASAVRVITAYQLGLVITLLPAAALGESLGFRRVFAGGVAVFTGASVLCALSPSLPWLVAARFLQGFGGAAIMSLGVALLRFVVSEDQLGTAIGWNALVVALSSAAGPAIGAAILSVAPWTWLFAVNVPIGIGVLTAARALPEITGTRRPLVPTDVALSAGTFALLVVGAEWAPSTPALAIMLFVGAAICATTLLRREAGQAVPLIPLDLLRRPSFLVSVVASILCFAGQSAGLVALPFYLQHTLGLTPLMTGLYLTPWPLAVAVAGPMAGRWANYVSTAWLCLAGGVLLAGGLGGAAFWLLHGQALALALCAVLCGLGFGLFNVPNNRNMFLSAPSERSGAAGGLQSVARLTGQTAGAVLMSVLFSLWPLDVATEIGLVSGAALTLAAGATSILRLGTAAAGARSGRRRACE
ncbi:MFS transporter [Reyranella sp.]|uniref:MFS transporter n=1 Tax=Reyranella sp. TaxID=1929291 RepID=UPI0027300C93|nr:MFS transporter [Reyranella sp.]MDP2377882.1 MFS transporter [Reyranella sp.]